MVKVFPVPVCPYAKIVPSNKYQKIKVMSKVCILGFCHHNLNARQNIIKKHVLTLLPDNNYYFVQILLSSFEQFLTNNKDEVGITYCYKHTNQRLQSHVTHSSYLLHEPLELDALSCLGEVSAEQLKDGVVNLIVYCGFNFMSHTRSIFMSNAHWCT